MRTKWHQLQLKEMVGYFKVILQCNNDLACCKHTGCKFTQYLNLAFLLSLSLLVPVLIYFYSITSSY